MPQTYIHLSGRDIDSEIMQMYGIEEEEETEEKQCNRCMKEYRGDEEYCPRCGTPFSHKGARDAEKLKQIGKDLVQKRMNGMNEDEVRELVKSI